MDIAVKTRFINEIEELVEEVLEIKNGEFKMQNEENTPSLRATPHEGN